MTNPKLLNSNNVCSNLLKYIEFTDLHKSFPLYAHILQNIQVHLNKLECRGKVHLFQ